MPEDARERPLLRRVQWPVRQANGARRGWLKHPCALYGLRIDAADDDVMGVKLGALFSSALEKAPIILVVAASDQFQDGAMRADRPGEVRPQASQKVDGVDDPVRADPLGVERPHEAQIGGDAHISPSRSLAFITSSSSSTAL
jgi:hypothetical protein